MYINRYWLIFLSNCTLFINYILFVKLVKETIVRDSDFLVERFDVKKNFFSIYLTLFFIFKYFSKLDIHLSSSNFDYTFIFNLPQYFVYFYIFCTSERIIRMRKKFISVFLVHCWIRSMPAKWRIESIWCWITFVFWWTRVLFER